MSISSKKCLQDAESIWKAPEQAEAFRRKVQEKSFPLELETIHPVMSYLLKREWNLERPKSALWCKFGISECEDANHPARN